MPDPLAHVAALFGPYANTVKPLLPGATLVLGVGSLLWGGTIWRAVRIGSGLLLGVGLGAAIGAQLQDARVGVVAAAVLAIGVALTFYLVERVAVAVLGGGVGVLLAQAIWPALHGGHAADSGVLVVAGLCGTALSGFVHQPAIKGVTAMFGALLVANSIGQADKLPVVLGLGVVGWGWQMFGGRGGSAEPAAPKKRRGRSA